MKGSQASLKVSYLSLFELTEHHDRGRPVLPDHPPKVIHSVLQRALCHYVLMPLLVSLHGNSRKIETINCTFLRKNHSIFFGKMTMNGVKLGTGMLTELSDLVCTCHICDIKANLWDSYNK